MKTFPDIWEKEAKWLAGPQILTSVVESLRGKSLVASRNESQLDIKLPLKEVFQENDVPIYELFFVVPPELRQILEEQLQSVMNVYRRKIMALLIPFGDHLMTPQLVAEINAQIADRERESESLRRPTLADFVAEAFGLLHLCRPAPPSIINQQIRERFERRRDERDYERQYGKPIHR